jgi:hypothetical protein
MVSGKKRWFLCPPEVASWSLDPVSGWRETDRFKSHLAETRLERPGQAVAKSEQIWQWIKKVETIINIINHEYFVEILTQRKGTFGPWPSMALSTFQRPSRHFFWGSLDVDSIGNT